MFQKKNILRLVLQFFYILFFIFFFFPNSSAQIIISEVFPNTIDDKNLEYIKIKNFWNDTIFLNNWYLKDKSGKKYFFSQDEKIEKFEEKKYLRINTKIILNNTNEEVFLYDNFWNIENSFSYKKSKKSEKIINWYKPVIENNQDEINNNKENKIDENFLENIWNIFEEKNIVYKDLERIDCEEFLNWEKFGEILWKINNWNLAELEKKYLEKCKNLEKKEDNIGEDKAEEKLKLPEIILEFQRPSYILDLDKLEDKKFFKFEKKSLSLEFSLPDREKEAAKKEIKEFFCDNKKEECKINFNLEKSFWGIFSKKNYLCEIKIWEEKIKKCNPNTIIFKEWETDIFFKIYEKNNENNFVEKNVKIINIPSLNSSLLVKREEAIKEEERNDEKKEENQKKEEGKENEDKWLNEKEEKMSEKEKNIEIKKINILEPKIIVQSGLTGENICKSKPCSVNLLYETNNKREKCIWDFWNWVSKSNENNKKCNPSYVKFEKTWNFFVKLKVYDELDEENFKEEVLYFENIIPNLNSFPLAKGQEATKEVKKFDEENKKIETKKNNLEEKYEEKDKLEKKEVWENGEFYIFLQGKLKKNILWERNTINLFTKKNGAKINFWLKFENLKKLRKIKYEWKFWNLKFFTKKNPKSYFFPTWRHFIIVRAKYKKRIIASDFLVLNIIKREKIDMEKEKLKLKKFRQKKFKKLKLKKVKIKKEKKFKKPKKQKFFKSKTKIISSKRKKKLSLTWILSLKSKGKGLQNKKNFEKLKKIDFKIILQWKKSEKKIFKNDKIICYTKKNKTCKINLWLEKFKAIRWLKYVWKFSDWRIVKKKNPKSFDFKVGNYNVILEIFYKKKIIKTEKINIFVYDEIGKVKKKKNKKINSSPESSPFGQKERGTKKIKKEKQKNFFVQTVNAWYINEKNSNEKWFFYGLWYLFIGFLVIYLIYIILQKEDFLEE